MSLAKIDITNIKESDLVKIYRNDIKVGEFYIKYYRSWLGTFVALVKITKISPKKRTAWYTYTQIFNNHKYEYKEQGDEDWCYINYWGVSGIFDLSNDFKQRIKLSSEVDEWLS